MCSICSIPSICFHICSTSQPSTFCCCLAGSLQSILFSRTIPTFLPASTLWIQHHFHRIDPNLESRNAKLPINLILPSKTDMLYPVYQSAKFTLDLILQENKSGVPFLKSSFRNRNYIAYFLSGFQTDCLGGGSVHQTPKKFFYSLPPGHRAVMPHPS